MDSAETGSRDLIFKVVGGPQHDAMFPVNSHSFPLDGQAIEAGQVVPVNCMVTRTEQGVHIECKCGVLRINSEPCQAKWLLMGDQIQIGASTFEIEQLGNIASVVFPGADTVPNEAVAKPAINDIDLESRDQQKELCLPARQTQDFAEVKDRFDELSNKISSLCNVPDTGNEVAREKETSQMPTMSELESFQDSPSGSSPANFSIEDSTHKVCPPVSGSETGSVQESFCTESEIESMVDAKVTSGPSLEQLLAALKSVDAEESVLMPAEETDQLASLQEPASTEVKVQEESAPTPESALTPAALTPAAPTPAALTPDVGSKDNKPVVQQKVPENEANLEQLFASLKINTREEFVESQVATGAVAVDNEAEVASEPDAQESGILNNEEKLENLFASLKNNVQGEAVATPDESPEEVKSQIEDSIIETEAVVSITEDSLGDLFASLRNKEEDVVSENQNDSQVVEPQLDIQLPEFKDPATLAEEPDTTPVSEDASNLALIRASINELKIENDTAEMQTPIDSPVESEVVVNAIEQQAETAEVTDCENEQLAKHAPPPATESGTARRRR